MKVPTNRQTKRRIITNVPLVVIGALLIIYASLGIVYLQKQVEFQGLGLQMSLQRTILLKPPPDIEELGSQLKEAESLFEITPASISSSNQTTDIYGVLVDLGRNSNAEVMSMEASPPTRDKGGTVNGTILPYSLVVRGKQSDLLGFISSLIQGARLLEGLELKSIDIKNGALPDDLGTLNLKLCIHTWPDATSGTKEEPPLTGVKK
ncbi:MAG: hypothetical protein PHV74_15135 [Dehalococcoidia bacterium]|nr:hypothetical protein [Dehalococcoidia bacterium]